MKGMQYILMLLHICDVALEDVWMNWAVSIKTKNAAEFCYGVLVTYTHALTTCECATHPDFILPEFLRKSAGPYSLEIRENQEGYQSRKAIRFDPHPKCTSNYYIQGFLAYNFAIVTAAVPFEATDYVQPIKHFTLDSVGALQNEAKCTLMGRNDSLKKTFPINLKIEQDCSKRASLALGSEPINFEEEGMFCADLYMSVHCNNTSGNCENDDSFGTNEKPYPQQANNSGPNVPVICDGLVVSGAPVVCDGELVGLVGHGLCILNSVPVIISRIELTNSIIRSLSDGEKLARTQGFLEISATVIILWNL